jgi:hypothetical protein
MCIAVMHASFPADIILHDLNILIIAGGSINYEILKYFSPSSNCFASALCSQTSPICVLPLACKIKLYTRTRQQEKLYYFLHVVLNVYVQRTNIYSVIIFHCLEDVV